MKNDTLKYLLDLMEKDERELFEKELAVSEELRKEVSGYSAKLGKIKEFGEIKADQRYFNTIIPKFRESLARRERPSLVPRLAAAFATAAFAVSLFFFTGIESRAPSTATEAYARYYPADDADQEFYSVNSVDPAYELFGSHPYYTENREVGEEIIENYSLSNGAETYFYLFESEEYIGDFTEEEIDELISVLDNS